MKKRAHNIYAQSEILELEIERLEKSILLLEKRMEHLFAIERNHLLRVKNGEEISDQFISYGQAYRDLTPEKAWEIYQQKDFNFILVDVSDEGFRPIVRLPEAIHIPWEHFRERSLEITSPNIPILVISEDGTRSILACELLVKRGLFNCCNISGGYLHWQGSRMRDLEESA